MPSAQVETESRSWDLSPVLDLLNSLRSHAVDDTFPGANKLPITEPLAVGTSERIESNLRPTHNSDVLQKPSDTSSKLQALGDFQKIFQFLGTANLVLPTDSAPPLEQLPSKVDYASDGATYISNRRNLSTQEAWPDATDVDESNTATDRPITSSQSKKARWRQNKRANKESKKSQKSSSQQHSLLSDSEAYTIAKKTPARKASVHFLRNESPSPCHPRSRVPSSNLIGASDPKSCDKESTTSKQSHLPQGDVRGLQLSLDSTTELDEQSANQDNNKGNQPHSHSVKASLSSSHKNLVPPGSTKTNLKLIPASVPPLPAKTTPKIVRTSPLPSTPSTAPTKLSLSSTMTTPISHTVQVTPSTSLPRPPRRTVDIEPIILRSGDDRNWALLMKLIENFYEDRKYLVSPMNLTTHNNHPDGIHVFIDASNIFIGFMEQLRRSRNIPTRVHITQIDPSFDSLALLIERRRPVAKRVLVGSAPENPAFAKARAVGYKCSILDKVYKARELTERQIFFRNRELGLVPPNAKAPLHGARPGMVDCGNGLETSTPQYAPAALVEQGVDEILHMNILQSLVDNAMPSTMVLATGDGAQAEYSDGFMAMAERALKKGWSVELVTWSKNISQLYTRKKFTDQWGPKFRIIFLDDYAEEMLDL